MKQETLWTGCDAYGDPIIAKELVRSTDPASRRRAAERVCTVGGCTARQWSLVGAA